MILKVFRKSLSQVPYAALFNKTAYYLSNDNDDGSKNSYNLEGFSNFKRKRTAKDNKSE